MANLHMPAVHAKALNSYATAAASAAATVTIAAVPGACTVIERIIAGTKGGAAAHTVTVTYVATVKSVFVVPQNDTRKADYGDAEDGGGLYTGVANQAITVVMEAIASAVPYVTVVYRQWPVT